MSVPDPIRQLDAILKPKSVAVIGASTSPDKIGYEILKNILDSGFKGSVYPINPRTWLLSSFLPDLFLKQFRNAVKPV
jgi:predicted CoA-binding protein